MDWPAYEAQYGNHPFHSQAIHEVKQLRDANDRLMAVIGAILPGTLHAQVAAIWELAVRECGHDELSSRPPTASIEDELKRLRGINDDYQKIKELEAEVERLRVLLRRWVDWLKRSGPEGSNQWEKFDSINRDTLAALEPE
jgi:hypothetical protein